MAARAPQPGPGSAPPGAQPASGGGAQRGEVAELRALLRTVAMEKDSKRKRDVLRKVVAYQTLGVDVSRLFPEMVIACNTRDFVCRRMIYHYVSAYAVSHPDTTLLAINTLTAGTRDEDPQVRAMSLRALSSLGVLSVLEYIVAPLRAGLADPSGYVRATAVMAVLKIFHLSPETVREGDYVDALYNALRDREPQVVVNAVCVLNEVLSEEGGIAVNQAIVHHLLGRLRELSDWGQCVVMEVVSRYRPASEEETFGIMNLLDGCLKVAHSGVVLAATKCFLALTEALPEIGRQVALRLKTPLLTLCASSSPEVAYAVLSHAALLIERHPGVFDDEFKQVRRTRWWW
jgi:AP-4 complex subunit beta-1